MNKFTKAKEQVIQIFWKIERGYEKDVIKYLNYPKSASNNKRKCFSFL